MKKKGFGGGNTVTGIKFERGRDILSILENTAGYSVKSNIVYYSGKEVARSYRQYGLYKYLESQNIDYKKIISKRLLPDEALYVIVNNTLFIIEMKFQEDSRFVYEDLQTCRFKKIQFTKLLDKKGMNLEYIYFLDNHFKHSKYKDILDYVHEVGCHYFFEELPLNFLGFEQTR